MISVVNFSSIYVLNSVHTLLVTNSLIKNYLVTYLKQPFKFSNPISKAKFGILYKVKYKLRLIHFTSNSCLIEIHWKVSEKVNNRCC